MKKVFAIRCLVVFCFRKMFIDYFFHNFLSSRVVYKLRVDDLGCNRRGARRECDSTRPVEPQTNSFERF